MCNYQGYEFGANYLDSICIEGFLWDADSGDEGGFTSGGDIPCPCCNTIEFLKAAHLDALDGGSGLSMGAPHVAMLSWEAAIFKARLESPEIAEEFLSQLSPFFTDDWPNRQAVFLQPSLWDETVTSEWRYSPPTPAPDGRA